MFLEFMAIGLTEIRLEQNRLTQALAWFRDIGGLHFANAYIAAVAADKGNGPVIPFDRDLRHMPDITLVEDPGPSERS